MFKYSVLPDKQTNKHIQITSQLSNHQRDNKHTDDYNYYRPTVFCPTL